jgi:type VI protein secretion system component VasA
LLSNLTLNYLSLSDNEQSLPALRSLLRTYNFTDSTAIEQQIMGLRSLTCEKQWAMPNLEDGGDFVKAWQ